VKPVAGGEARKVTNDPKRGIRRYQWAEDDRTLHDLFADGEGRVRRNERRHEHDAARRLDVATAKEAVIARNPKVDVGTVLIHPRRHVVEAVDFPATRQAWSVVDPAVKADFEGLRALAKGDFNVVSRARVDATWLVSYDEDRGPVRYFTWDRKARKGTFLFSARPKLEGLALAEMRPFTIKARDGLELNGYLTLPVGLAPKGLPAVLPQRGEP
jgi:hypothetical protein